MSGVYFLNFLNVPVGLTLGNSTFSPCNEFMCVVRISEQTRVIYVYSIIGWHLNGDGSCFSALYKLSMILVTVFL